MHCQGRIYFICTVGTVRINYQRKRLVIDGQCIGRLVSISEYGDEEGPGKETEDWLKKWKENTLTQHNGKLGERIVRKMSWKTKHII